jgi:hypothetical protein
MPSLRRLKVPRPAIKGLWPLARHFWRRRRQPQRLFDEKGLIPPVTFDRASGKFPPMKAWIYICAIVFAAGMVTALADETNTPTGATTNTPTGATTNLPANTNEVAVPPPMTVTSAPPPAIVHKVKPPVVVPLTQTSAVPAHSNITAAPLKTTNAITPPPMTTSTSAPAVAGEVRPPDDVSLIQTGAVPAQSNITVAPPSESSGTGRKGVLAISVAFLAVVGGLTVFMLRRSRKADHASLITRAMNENKDEDKDTGKHEEKREDKPEEKKPEKEEDKKFPPPMT